MSTESQVRNVALVHGAWADGSGWQRAHDILRARGYNVSVVQNPLTSLADDVAAVDRILARQDGPTLLVGHSYGGVVITEAGAAANVVGLVYIAAFVPDVGESVASLIDGGAPPPLQPSADGFLFFNPVLFPQVFAHDLPTAQGAFLAAAQLPPAGSAFGTPVSHAATTGGTVSSFSFMPASRYWIALSTSPSSSSMRPSALWAANRLGARARAFSA